MLNRKRWILRLSIAVAVVALARVVFVWIPGTVEYEISKTTKLQPSGEDFRVDLPSFGLKRRQRVSIQVATRDDAERIKNGRATLVVVALLDDGAEIVLSGPGEFREDGIHFLRYSAPDSVRPGAVSGVRIRSSDPMVVSRIAWEQYTLMN